MKFHKNTFVSRYVVYAIFVLAVIGFMVAAPFTSFSDTRKPRTTRPPAETLQRPATSIPPAIVKERLRSDPIFVVVGQHGGFYLSDATAETWTRASHWNTQPLRALAYGAGRLVAMGPNNFQSTDATTWENFNLPQGAGGPYWDIAYGGGRFVAVGDNGKIIYSHNGLDWHLSTFQGETVTLRGVAYGNGRFVAVGTKILYSSSGGQDWSEAPAGSGGLMGVAFGDNRFVAVGAPPTSAESSRVFTSTDGVNWIKREPATTKRLWTVAFDQSSRHFIAGGDGGTIITSNDYGVTWQHRNSGTTFFIKDIACGNGISVATGSPDVPGVGLNYVGISMDGGVTWSGKDLDLGMANRVVFRP